MSRNARLRVRVVLVEGGTGAMDARRRVAEVLMRAAHAGAAPSEDAVPVAPANEPPTPPREKAA